MRNLVRSTAIMLLFFGSYSTASAQIAEAIEPNSASSSSKQAVPVQVDVDHAAFAYEESNSLVEMYLAFEASTLSYVSTDQGFLASLPVSIQVVRSTQASLASGNV